METTFKDGFFCGESLSDCINDIQNTAFPKVGKAVYDQVTRSKNAIVLSISVTC